MAMVFIDFSDEYEGNDILTLFLQYTFGRRTLFSNRPHLSIVLGCSPQAIACKYFSNQYDAFIKKQPSTHQYLLLPDLFTSPSILMGVAP
jgi:hypothetical protein